MSNFHRTGYDGTEESRDLQERSKAQDLISEIENAIDVHNMRTPMLAESSTENLHDRKKKGYKEKKRAKLPTSNPEQAILLQEHPTTRS